MMMSHQQPLLPQYPYPTVPLMPVFVQPHQVVEILPPPQPGFATLPMVANTGQYIQESSWCEICEYDYSPVTREAHVQTKRHLKDLRNYVRQQRLRTKGPTRPKVMEPDSCYCPICDILIEKKHNVKGHIKGRLHIKNAKNQGVPPAPFEGLKGYCHICDLSLPACPGDPMLTHIKGQRHIANLKLIQEGKPILTEAPQVLRRKEKQKRLAEQMKRWREGVGRRGRGRGGFGFSRRGNSRDGPRDRGGYGHSRRGRDRGRNEPNSFFLNDGFSNRSRKKGPTGWVSTSVDRSAFEPNNPIKGRTEIAPTPEPSLAGRSTKIKEESERQEMNIWHEDGQNEGPAEKTIHLQLPNAEFGMFRATQIREGLEEPILNDGLELKYFDPILLNQPNGVEWVSSCFLEFENRQCAERAIKVLHKSGLFGRSITPMMAQRGEELSRRKVRSQERLEYNRGRDLSDRGCYGEGYGGGFQRGKGARGGRGSRRIREDWVWNFPPGSEPGYGGGYRGNFRR